MKNFESRGSVFKIRNTLFYMRNCTRFPFSKSGENGIYLITPKCVPYEYTFAFTFARIKIK